MRLNRYHLLHKRNEHTNLSFPYSSHVTESTFPDQNTDLLGTIIPVKFRNMYNLGESEKIDCKVIRCDNVEPYKMVTISDNFYFIFVLDSRYYKSQVVQYPLQLSELIGITCFNQYNFMKKEIKAVTIRVDNGEPCQSVLVEFVSNDTIRILLGDECLSRLSEYYYEDDTDYNGRDSRDYFLLKWKDLNGGRSRQNSTLEIFDGGGADLLKDTLNRERTIEDIVNLRKLVFNNKKIYSNIN